MSDFTCLTRRNDVHERGCRRDLLRVLLDARHCRLKGMAEDTKTLSQDLITIHYGLDGLGNLAYDQAHHKTRISLFQAFMASYVVEYPVG